MQAKAAQLSALFGGRMPMTMTSPPGGSTHVPTVDDIANYLFRIKELQNWIDTVYVLMYLQSPLTILTMPG